MGVPPLRIDLFTSIPGVDFDECYADRIEQDWSGVTISLISLGRLRESKRAAGRLKDLADLEQLDQIDDGE
jgi:hypothetical protein